MATTTAFDDLIKVPHPDDGLSRLDIGDALNVPHVFDVIKLIMAPNDPVLLDLEYEDLCGNRAHDSAQAIVSLLSHYWDLVENPEASPFLPSVLGGLDAAAARLIVDLASFGAVALLNRHNARTSKSI